MTDDPDGPFTLWGENIDTDPEHTTRLMAKLEPATLRLTLAFSALYQLAHELLKDAVVGNLAGFYGRSDAAPDGWLWPEGRAQYRAEVLELRPRNKGPVEASLAWYVKRGVLTDQDVAGLDAVYKHRHDLTHELAKYLVDVDQAPDAQLFATAVDALNKVCRYWAEMEAAAGTIDPDDLDGVVSGPVALLQACLAAVTDGL